MVPATDYLCIRSGKIDGFPEILTGKTDVYDKTQKTYQLGK